MAGIITGEKGEEGVDRFPALHPREETVRCDAAWSGWGSDVAGYFVSKHGVVQLTR
jgi:hypothetical protein